MTRNRKKSGLRSDFGATMLETSLILGLVTVVAMASISTFGAQSGLTLFVTNAALRGPANDKGAGGKSDGFTGGACLTWAKAHAKYCNTTYGLFSTSCYGKGAMDLLDYRCPN